MCPTYHPVTFSLWVTSCFLSGASLPLPQQWEQAEGLGQFDSQSNEIVSHKGFPVSVSIKETSCSSLPSQVLDKNHHSALPWAVSTGTSSQELALIVTCFPEHKSQKSVYYYLQLILSKFKSSLGTCNFKIFCSFLSHWTFTRLIQ